MSTSYDTLTGCKGMQSPGLSSVWTKGTRDSLIFLTLFHGRPVGGAWLSAPEAAGSQRLKDRIPICPKVIAPNLAC